MSNLNVRTTIRLDRGLKYLIAKMALNRGIKQQDIIKKAIREYLEKQGKVQAKKIMFPKHNLGVKLDKITRDDIYDL